MRNSLKIIALAALMLFASCSAVKDNGKESPAHSVSHNSATASVFAMDTYMTITAYGDDAQAAVDESKEKIAELDALWNVNDERSDIFRINSRSAAEVSGSTAELLRFAKEMYIDTDGALDITLYPVLREWGFTAGDHHVPDDDTLTSLLAQTGSEKISVSGNSVMIPDGFMLDLGSVAKGMTGDIISGIMNEHGVSSALLDLGGNIQAVGKKPDGSDWKIGLKDPHGDGLFGVLEVSDKAVVTSGGYERYFEQDGQIYWHILDSKTGKPAKNGLISATVVGSEGRLCDALSTALFVMGEEKAVSYWRGHDGFDMILITDDDRVLISEDIAKCYSSNGLYEKTEVIKRGEK